MAEFINRKGFLMTKTHNPLTLTRYGFTFTDADGETAHFVEASFNRAIESGNLRALLLLCCDEETMRLLFTAFFGCSKWERDLAKALKEAAIATIRVAYDYRMSTKAISLSRVALYERNAESLRRNALDAIAEVEAIDAMKDRTTIQRTVWP